MSLPRRLTRSVSFEVAQFSAAKRRRNLAVGASLSFIHNSDNSNGDGPTHGMRFAPELEAEIDLPNKHGAS